MILADAVVLALREWGVRYVFGVSGANIEHVHDAIHRLGDGRLSSVLARREDGAAYMADSRARVHRTLGVCCCTSGGAMMNLAVGLAESYADSVPVLAIVGAPPRSLHGRGAFQDSSGIGRSVDAVGMLDAITKRVYHLEGTADFWDVVASAARTALSGRPGPVAIVLPRDLCEAEVGAAPADWPAALGDLCAPTAPDDVALARLFDLIRRARRPVFLVGQGVRRAGAQRAVAEFARRTGVAVTTTLGARAEFPNDDPRYLGVVGAAGHPSAHRALAEQADLIVAIGTGLSVMTRSPLGELDPARVAVVNIDPANVHLPAPPLLTVRADAAKVLDALLARLDASPFTVAGFAGYERRRFVPRLAPAVGPPEGDDDLRQSAALTILERILPVGGHILLDAGNCASAAIHLTDVPPRTSSTIALGGGGMGYGVAGAIGAQLGAPEGTRTVALCGDGAFLMNGLEVHTAVDLGLPILFVIFNNRMHGMCVTRQQLFFASRLECVSYPEVNVDSVARGLGPADRLWVGSAGTEQELAACLDDYRRCPEPIPGVLELRLRREEVPPFTPFLPADEPTMSITMPPTALAS